jgi:hypothetical protein
LPGRHHSLKAAARIGRHVLPVLPLFRDAEAQVARLAELHADDTATRIATPRALATALVVLATLPRRPRRPPSPPRPPTRCSAYTVCWGRQNRLADCAGTCCAPSPPSWPSHPSLWLCPRPPRRSRLAASPPPSRPALLLHQPHEATGQPPATTLQTLAIAAGTSRDTPSSGQGSAG